MTKIALPLAAVDPLVAFASFAGDPFALLLDGASEPLGRGRYSYLCVRPRTVLRDASFADVAKALGETRASLPSLPPFQGGAAGMLAYDMAWELERLPGHQPDDLGLPRLAFGLFDAIAAWDHAEGKAWVIGPPAKAETLRDQLQASTPLPPIDWSPKAQFTPDQSLESYQAAIRRVVDYIHAGDIFQANLSQRWRGAMPDGLSPFMLYRRLRELSPAPFAAYLGLGGNAVLSSSPERFLALSRDGWVEARPIKGTRPRGASPAEDEALAAELLASDKDRAENLMIVDLMRNDLSRVCALGSVTVPELFTVEHFAQVHHLVSAVEGRLAPGLGPCQLLAATFPPGSITGAPKVRAMEIIAELEPQRRGPVFGAMGWIGWDGAMDMNVAIRTMTVTQGRVCVRAGGGIVAESDALAEYAETLLKAGAMLTSLEGKS